jgi:hypothetical protein
VRTLHKPTLLQVESTIHELLSTHQLSVENIDCILLGENGDIARRSWFDQVKNNFSNSSALYFKHFCGDYDTATNFAEWLSCEILNRQFIPPVLYYEDSQKIKVEKPIKYILIYNNYLDVNQSLILLKRQ